MRVLRNSFPKILSLLGLIGDMRLRKDIIFVFAMTHDGLSSIFNPLFSHIYFVIALIFEFYCFNDEFIS